MSSLFAEPPHCSPPETIASFCVDNMLLGESCPSLEACAEFLEKHKPPAAIEKEFYDDCAAYYDDISSRVCTRTISDFTKEDNSYFLKNRSVK